MVKESHPSFDFNIVVPTSGVTLLLYLGSMEAYNWLNHSSRRWELLWIGHRSENQGKVGKEWEVLGLAARGGALLRDGIDGANRFTGARRSARLASGLS